MLLDLYGSWQLHRWWQTHSSWQMYLHGSWQTHGSWRLADARHVARPVADARLLANLPPRFLAPLLAPQLGRTCCFAYKTVTRSSPNTGCDGGVRGRWMRGSRGRGSRGRGRQMWQSGSMGRGHTCWSTSTAFWTSQGMPSQPFAPPRFPLLPSQPSAPPHLPPRPYRCSPAQVSFPSTPFL